MNTLSAFSHAVGPNSGPQLIVHADLGEEVGVSEWLEHGAVQLSLPKGGAP
jgi:hypothetical protein